MLSAPLINPLPLAKTMAAALILFGASVTEAHQSSLHRSMVKLSADESSTPRSAPAKQTRSLSLDFIDAETGQPMAATVRITDLVSGKKWWPKDWTRSHAMRRMQDWWSLASGTALELPNGEVEIEAIGGLTIKLNHFYRPQQQHWWGGNTHLHMFSVSRGYADRYLQVVPRADGLDTVYVSHLERVKVDETYVSNQYSATDMQELSNSVISYGYGQETRHNFGEYGQGYGHALLLDIPKLIQPVSIGQSLTAKGADYPPLAPSLRAADKAGGTVVWAHNDFGMEDIPNWLNGRIHALNSFDGGDRTHYEQSFYRYLDVGLRVPFSSGTDWFMLDFARAYVYGRHKPDAEGWLKALRQGRSYITNGPLLEFSANEKMIGDTLNIDSETSKVSISAKALGRTDFKKLELIFNGDVVYSVASEALNGHFQATMNYDFVADSSGWLAVRIPWHNNKNEMGEVLRAHTSPIYLQVDGKAHFKPWVARGLVAEMRDSIDRITHEGEFESPTQRASVIKVYQRAIQQLDEKISALHD
ncbi:CehA/McbA family metallohydrolase [Pseudomaricurvus alkylphenolicus]|uniref:CehA/McbA family metallohydrolase n=1 Tax=Pseudomaricurvus alkylphenolicus TaxID=1306991 RepID=UPI001420DFCF|nr:CehA/McbA family metallohydrolase [Pseudomaricurvus alkylphenolicus]NIB40600.1 CehA/McbA family metallohydrolase [Pseudomaricurvus alkylphenolicus]